MILEMQQKRRVAAQRDERVNLVPAVGINRVQQPMQRQPGAIGEFQGIGDGLHHHSRLTNEAPPSTNTLWPVM